MKFLVLQQLAIEPPALIDEIIRSEGHALQIINLELDPQAIKSGRNMDVPSQSKSEWDGLIIMGGPQSANDVHSTAISTCLGLIADAIKHDVPMLGICLGAQLMAKAAGGIIQASPVRELGWHPVFPTASAPDDALFRALPDEGLKVFQWHGESFTLPQSGALLASHPDVPHQAFRLGKAQYGLQFHVEVNEAIIQTWIETGENERLYLGKAGIAGIHKQTGEYLQAMQAFCRVMILNWLQMISRPSI